VHEDVVSAFALNEAEALLVREPFDGAFCQLLFLLAKTTTVQAADR
jgi:hypothetical protein